MMLPQCSNSNSSPNNNSSNNRPSSWTCQTVNGQMVFVEAINQPQQQQAVVEPVETKACCQRRRRHPLKVQFAEDRNQFYTTASNSNDSEDDDMTATRCWYSTDDYQQFRLDTAVQVARIVQAEQDAEDSDDENDNNNTPTWSQTLLRVYQTFETAQSAQQVRQALQEQYHPACFDYSDDDDTELICRVGLERVAVRALAMGVAPRQRALWTELQFLQRAPLGDSNDSNNRAELLRHAVRRHSRAVRLYARYVACQVAAQV